MAFLVPHVLFHGPTIVQLASQCTNIMAQTINQLPRRQVSQQTCDLYSFTSHEFFFFIISYYLSDRKIAFIVTSPFNLVFVGSEVRISNRYKIYQAARCHSHYTDVIMSAMTSQITGVSIVYSTIYSVTDQRKHQNSASLAFMWGIHR